MASATIGPDSKVKQTITRQLPKELKPEDLPRHAGNKMEINK